LGNATSKMIDTFHSPNTQRPWLLNIEIMTILAAS
jgi:hypothetical protein